MSTAEINTPDGKVLSLNIPEGASSEDIHSAALAASQHYQNQNQNNGKQLISNIARPLLEGGGMVGGGMLGLPTGPIGAAGGGILGFGMGNQAANILDQKMGLMKPPQNLSDAVQSGGQSLYEGVKNEAIGQAMGPALKLIGKVAKPIASTMSGIPIKDFDVLADNPKSILPSYMENASKTLQGAREAFGVPQSGPEATEAAIDKALRDEKTFINSLREKIKEGISLTPKEIVDGNQATNTLLKREKDPEAKRGFMLLKNKFEAMMTPEVIASNKDYSIGKSGANFRKILPITKSGDPAVVRTLYMLSRMAGPQALISIPAMNAIPTIAGGIASRFAANPSLRRATLPPLLHALSVLQDQLNQDGGQ